MLNSRIENQRRKEHPGDAKSGARVRPRLAEVPDLLACEPHCHFCCGPETD
jgi:hypothetical protein